MKGARLRSSHNSLAPLSHSRRVDPATARGGSSTSSRESSFAPGYQDVNVTTFKHKQIGKAAMHFPPLSNTNNDPKRHEPLTSILTNHTNRNSHCIANW